MNLSPALSTPKSPVTLNLFQGPSCRKHGTMGHGAGLAAKFEAATSAGAATWILKQVQDDEQEMTGAIAPAMEFIR